MGRGAYDMTRKKFDIGTKQHDMAADKQAKDNKDVKNEKGYGDVSLDYVYPEVSRPSNPLCIGPEAATVKGISCC
jgi:hypothetical protein